jgi:hypothetical protein
MRNPLRWRVRHRRIRIALALTHFAAVISEDDPRSAFPGCAWLCPLLAPPSLMAVCSSPPLVMPLVAHCFNIIGRVCEFHNRGQAPKRAGDAEHRKLEHQTRREPPLRSLPAPLPQLLVTATARSGASAASMLPIRFLFFSA